jgi:hypothetical protein
MGLLADWQIRKDVKIVPFAEEASRPGVVDFGLTTTGASRCETASATAS